MSIYTEHRKFLEKFSIYPIKSRISNLHNIIKKFQEKIIEISFFKDKDSFQFTIYQLDKNYKSLVQDLYITDIHVYTDYVVSKYPSETKFLMIKNDDIDTEGYIENGLAEVLTINKLHQLNLEQYEYYSYSMTNLITDEEILHYKNLGFLH
jgi:hypothetical protein